MLDEGRKALVCFQRRLVCRLAAAITSAILSGSAFAAETEICRSIPGGRDADLRRTEWVENGEPSGAKLTLRDSRWKWAIAPSSIGLSIFCSACPQGGIGDGFLSLSLGPDHVEPSETNVSPDFVAVAFWLVTGEHLTFKSVSELETVALTGASGKARAVTAERDGRPYHAVAFIARDRCLRVTGIFSAKDGREVSVGDLRKISSLIAVERFTPTLSPTQQLDAFAPLSTKDLPLGDARKRAQKAKK